MPSRSSSTRRPTPPPSKPCAPCSTTPSVKRVDEITDPHDARPGEPTIYVGGAAAGQAVAALGVQNADGLAAEGYVLATGSVAGHPSVVLDGHDATGTFYAAQTLRQLVRAHSVPGVEVRDWPTFPLRGVIEGFYGTPWSHAARLDQLDFYGAHKMNTYVYSPKNDPFLRDQWRDPYPPDQLAQLKELVDRAIANHVKFTYALSPGLSVCYSSAADEQALVAKFQSLWDVGVRDFAIPLDDISYTSWNCDADQTKFGTGGAAAGAAQAYLLNAVQRDFIATHAGASRLQMVPTEYADVAASPYKNTIKAQLDPAIIVEWTGVGVIAPVITQQQAAAAKNVFGHDILVWDNYPVNDYVTDRLLLGPYIGRDTGLSGSLVRHHGEPDDPAGCVEDRAVQCCRLHLERHGVRPGDLVAGQPFGDGGQRSAGAGGPRGVRRPRVLLRHRQGAGPRIGRQARGLLAGVGAR